VVNVAVKPTSSIRLARRSIDKAGKARHRRNARPPRSLRRHPRDPDREAMLALC
jgi:chorismate synthase